MATESRVPNLMDLITNDEELQKAKAAIGEFFAEGARALTTDTVGAPVDILNMALGAVGVPVSQKPVGGSAWLREKTGQPTAPSLSEKDAERLAGNIAGSLVSPGKASADLATLLPALAGIIRKGGLDSLFMTHNIGGDAPFTPEGVRALADHIVSGGTFSSPSIAINQRTVFPFDTTPTLLMNPAQELFDPAVNPGALLYNRDAYVSRSRTLETPGPLDDLRMTEGAMPSAEKAMAILSSPRFKSFEEYESSPSGAALLRTPQGQKSPAAASYNAVDDAKTDALVAMQERSPEQHRYIWDMEHKAQNYDMTPEMFRAYQLKLQEIAQQNPELAAYMEMLPRVSSDYAELKLVGEMPLSSDYVSALILPNAVNPTREMRSANRYLQEAAHAVGIPSGTVWDLAPQRLRNALETSIERHVDDAIKKDEWLSFNNSSLNRYGLTGMSPLMGKDLMMESALEELADSKGLQHEVARWLTRKAVE